MVIFEKGDLRISLITPRLLRTEKGIFTDLPTQTVQNRDFEEVKYTLEENDGKITVKTDRVIFYVDAKTGNVEANFEHLRKSHFPAQQEHLTLLMEKPSLTTE